ncbi:MAG: NADPH-dependent FMN reductase [Flavobacteriales bacterium]
MEPMKRIFVINGSASSRSSNQKLIDLFSGSTKEFFDTVVFNDLRSLPHFDPERSVTDTPQAILDLRHEIGTADGILICTPEYVFSLPSGLKNALEWCVSATVFSDRPTGLITASAIGEKGHEELQLIMRTLMARSTPDTALLIQGVKGKINEQGEITDSRTKDDLAKFIQAFKALVDNER